jgi:hypothetical protein
MTRHLLIASLMFTGCATVGSTGSKGSTAPFQGEAALAKRRNEALDASKVATDCMKVKQGEEAGKGGIFAIVADADGKLSAKKIKWDGPEAMAQCIVDNAQKTPITPLPGPPVGVIWEFLPPGVTSAPPPAELPTAVNSRLSELKGAAQDQVDACARLNLPQDFPADIEISFYAGADGNVYAPSVNKSTSKDGGFDSCVLDTVAKQKLPTMDVAKPVPITWPFHVGKVDKL